VTAVDVTAPHVSSTSALVARDRLAADLEALPEPAKRIRGPQAPPQ
jgi:hypothetical protein